jgi:hypothetical protein
LGGEREDWDVENCFFRGVGGLVGVEVDVVVIESCVRTKAESGYVEVQSATAACRLPRSTHRLTPT